MLELLNQLEQNLPLFFLFFFRITALLVLSPIFGHRAIPNTLKIGLCLVISLIVFSSWPAPGQLGDLKLIQFILLAGKELLFGLVLGYVTSLFFSVVQTAGHIIDMQMGFGMVSVLDVQNNVSVPISGNLYHITLLITFFTVNGHLRLIKILLSSFTLAPVGKLVLDARLGLAAVEVFVSSFVLVVNVAMPMIVAGLLGELLMGMIVRTVPQLNIFVVGIPLKVLLGLLMLFLVLPFYVAFTDRIFESMFNSIQKMFYLLAGAA